MKTLTVALADLEGTPHGTASARTNVTVTARYTGVVVLTSGKIIPPAIKRARMTTMGVFEFEVYESDSTLVKAEYRGFAIRVEATIRTTGGGPPREVKVTRTVKVLTSATSPVSLGTLSPAEPVPPQWVTVADFADDLTATAEAARNDAATAAAAAVAAAARAATDETAIKRMTIRSANLFIKTTAYTNTSLSAGSAKLNHPHAGFYLSEYIPVVPGGDYVFNNVARQWWFTASNVYISDGPSLTPGAVRTAPTNAAYMRVTVTAANLNTAQVNAGTTLLPYDEGTIPRLAPESAPDVLLATDQTVFFDQKTNLFNKRTTTPNSVIASGQGSLSTNSGYHVSDWIPVKSLTSYTVAGNILRVTLYDETRAYVFTQSFTVPYTAPVTFTTPTRARWARLSVRNQSVGEAQLNEGATALPYVEGGATLKAEYLPADLIPAPRPILDADVAGVYAGPVVPDMAAQIPNNSVASDVYAAYDALTAAHPTFITRTQPGSAHDSQPIYCYTLAQPRPKGTSSLAPVLPRRKVVIISGTHGSEKASVWTLYNLVKGMCEDWATDERLAALRFNVEWVIIPVANPSGYNAFTRRTANGVDLARNWPSRWVQGTSGSQTYGGTAPLSEPETQATKAVLDAHPDALAVIDFHNFHSPSNNYDTIYACPGTVPTAELFDATTRRMDRKWRSDRPDIASPDPDVSFGLIDNAPGGSIGPEGAARGHKYAGTWEQCWKVPTEPGAPTYSSLTMTWGLESLVNLLSIMLNEESQ